MNAMKPLGAQTGALHSQLPFQPPQSERAAFPVLCFVVQSVARKEERSGEMRRRRRGERAGREGRNCVLSPTSSSPGLRVTWVWFVSAVLE